MLGDVDSPEPTETLPPPQGTPPSPRRLRRRRDEAKLGGVCAGVADYLGVDVTAVRLGAVLLAIMGPGVPAYLVAWLIVPEAGPGEPRWSPAAAGEDRRFDRGPRLLGAGLLAIAAIVVWDDVGWPGDRFLFPVLLIGAGVLLLTRTSTAADDNDALAPPSPLPPPPAPASAPAPAAPRRPRSKVTPAVVGLALLWAGIALLTDVSVETGLAVGVGILAAGLLTGAVVGGGRGLIFPAVILTAGLLVTAGFDVPFTGGIGERTWQVDSVADVDSPYRLAMGETVLDLRGLRPAAERVVEIEASVAIGHLEVRVPEGVPIDVQGSADVGDVRLLGRSDEGADVDAKLVEVRRPGVGVIELHLAVGLGEVEVIR